MRKRMISVLCAGIFLLGIVTGAESAIIRWTVNNGNFTSGNDASFNAAGQCPVAGTCGGVTGFFDWDTNLVMPIDWAFSATGGDTTPFPEFLYTPTTSTSQLPGNITFAQIGTNRIFRFNPLGNILTLLDTPVPSLLISNTDECRNCNPFRTTGDVFLSGTTVTAVPEPSAMLLFGAGGLGLIGYGRRRKKSAV